VAINALLIAKCLSCAFFAVLFLQSGFDKVFDFKGNLSWMTPHFEKSPLRALVPLLLSGITLLELVSGFGAAAAVVVLAMKGQHWIPVAAIGLCCFTLLCLFTGQRLAKDYPGAAVISAYFGVALISLYLLSLGFEVGLPS
jgi:uncharacterized membrane protein YphA (DoxX/SURF4 family)